METDNLPERENTLLSNIYPVLHIGIFYKNFLTFCISKELSLVLCWTWYEYQVLLCCVLFFATQKRGSGLYFASDCLAFIGQ